VYFWENTFPPRCGEFLAHATYEEKYKRGNKKVENVEEQVERGMKI
jgi:hypothetical protein